MTPSLEADYCVIDLPGYLRCLSTFNIYRLSESKVKGRFTVGRHLKNDIALPGSKISNYHYVLTYREGLGLILRNLSSNGTHLDRVFLKQNHVGIMKEGSVISLGPNTREFMYCLDHTVVPGTSFQSRYTRGRELGRGSFGTVYKCQDVSSSSAYALKTIDRGRFHLARDAERMIKREIQVLKALNSNHEHIVQLKEIFDEKPMIYIVLEFVPGGDLREYLNQSAPLTENMTIHFMIQICKGVEFIHGQGVAHRDLKPANILLTTDDPPKIKIADFGLSKLIVNGSFLKTRCGTPNYSAPEVLKSASAGYSEIVDSWSVGVIAFEMLTKALPFRWSPTKQGFLRVEPQRLMDLSPLSQFNHSEQCLSFIEDMLRECPHARLSIIRALKHEWLKPGSQVVLPNLDGDNALATLNPVFWIIFVILPAALCWVSLFHLPFPGYEAYDEEKELEKLAETLSEYVW